MNKIKLSMITLLTLGVSIAQAEVDLKVSGQGVFYYQTMDSAGNADLFDNGANSRGNAGLQLNANADLGNGFQLGYQETFLGTLGLEKNLVGASMQTAKTGKLNSHSMTKLFIQKDIENTTLKLGRQELPKALSPFAFSESWNVFKNTFDAAVVINKDIQDTTLVGAYVSQGNGQLVGTPGLVDLGTFDDMAGGVMKKGAYMLTIANKSIQDVPLTFSYYQMPSTDLSAMWADAKLNNLGEVKVSFQGGSIMNGAKGGNDTNAYGAKIFGKVNDIGLRLAYSGVNDGDVQLRNVGTGVKTPLYTQMILNQNFISHDNDTVVLSAVAPLPVGKLIAKYDMTKDNSALKNDYNELDVIYKFDAFGTKMLLAYVMQDQDNADTNNMIRVWSRYNF